MVFYSKNVLQLTQRVLTLSHREPAAEPTPSSEASSEASHVKCQCVHPFHTSAFVLPLIAPAGSEIKGRRRPDFNDRTVIIISPSEGREE